MPRLLGCVSPIPRIGNHVAPTNSPGHSRSRPRLDPHSRSLRTAMSRVRSTQVRPRHVGPSRSLLLLWIPRTKGPRICNLALNSILGTVLPSFARRRNSSMTPKLVVCRAFPLGRLWTSEGCRLTPRCSGQHRGIRPCVAAELIRR
jgi:hypothetical protein